MSVARALLPFAAVLVFSSNAFAEEPSCEDALGHGRAARDAGRLLEAREAFASCSREECSTTRDACTRGSEDLERAIPTTAFVVKDPSGRDLEATLTIDGKSSLAVGRAVALDPGVHVVDWSTGSGVRGSEKVTIVEGQRYRVVTLVANTPAAPPPAPDAAEVRRHSPVPWYLIGTGAVLVTAAGFIQLLALQEDGQSQQYLAHGTRDDLSEATARDFFDSSKSHHDAAVANQGIAITCAALGTAAIAAGVIWLVTRDRPARRVGLTGVRF